MWLHECRAGRNSCYRSMLVIKLPSLPFPGGSRPPDPPGPGMDKLTGALPSAAPPGVVFTPDPPGALGDGSPPPRKPETRVAVSRLVIVVAQCSGISTRYSNNLIPSGGVWAGHDWPSLPRG